MSSRNVTVPTPPLMARVDGVGQWLAPLGLRALLAWEFFEAGREKLQGENWFGDAADTFPLPFSLLGANVNWTLATWFELLGAIALLVGVGTRYAAATLFVLTVVAIHAVHWPAEWSSLAELWQGYAISNDGFGNYKLPLIYLAMLLPLMLGGAGRFSLDHLFASRRASSAPTSDLLAWGLVLSCIGATASLLLPWAGATLAVFGLALMAWPRSRATAAERLAAA